MQGSVSRVERDGYPVRNGGFTDHTDAIRGAVVGALAADRGVVGVETALVALGKPAQRQAARMGLLDGAQCPTAFWAAVDAL